MATVYKIKIKTVSAWVSYDEKAVKDMIERSIKECKDKDGKPVFENTEITVERK